MMIAILLAALIGIPVWYLIIAGLLALGFSGFDIAALLVIGYCVVLLVVRRMT